jgi:hypothetical protein
VSSHVAINAERLPAFIASIVCHSMNIRGPWIRQKVVGLTFGFCVTGLVLLAMAQRGFKVLPNMASYLPREVYLGDRTFFRMSDSHEFLEAPF